MTRLLTAAVAAAALMATPVAAQQIAPGAGAAEAGEQAREGARSDQGQNQDRTFATRAAESGHAEVALGEIGEEKAQHDRVRQFAERMVADHTKANQELMSIAENKGITLPDETPQASAAAALQNMSGEQFDRAFMQRMVEDHEKAVELFEQEAKNGQDEELKAFAEKQLPILREHLRMAEEIHGQMEQ